MKLQISLLGVILLAGCQSSNSAEPPAAATETSPAATTRTAGIDWPSFLGPNRDSKSPETGIITDWSKKPRILWQRDVGTGYAIGTISKGRMFQFDRYGDSARLVCLNAETGAELWKFEYASDYSDLYGYNNGPRCCPVVDDDRVYTFGVEGMLHCVSATTGKPIWKVDTQKQYGVIQNFFGVGSTPVVEGNLLIVNIGGSPAADAELPPGALDRVSGNGSGIVAFDKLTGKEAYKITDELASYASPYITTIAGRRWGFMFSRGGLVGFEPATGKVDFTYPWRSSILESVNASNPVVVGAEVLITETYGPGASLLKVKPGGYEVVWSDAKTRDKKMQCHWNTPIYIDGYVYGSSGRHTGNAELKCIEWKTGKERWSKPGLTRCSLLYVDKHFVCQGEDGSLRLLKVNPEKYEEVGEWNLVDEAAEDRLGIGKPPLLKYPAWAAPVLSHGLLYLRGHNKLVCLELIPAKK